MTATIAVRFPSVAWFQALAAEMARNEERFRKLGTIDARVGIEMRADDMLAQPCRFALSFETYTCDAVAELGAIDDQPVDFILSAPGAVWFDLVANIRANGEADLKHTLNYLHFGPVELKATNQMEADLFFRVNSSLQAFFDGAAAIETEFAP